MDKTGIGKFLADTFGISPDYTIYLTPLDRVEVYRPRTLDFISVPMSEDVTPFKEVLVLNEHKVKIDGKWILAKFAVNHPTKTVFLKVTNFGQGEVLYTVQNYE